MLVKQSTARNRMFKMISSTDHFSAKTGLTCTVNLSKNGGAFGAAGGAVSELASGWYQVALSTTDSNTLGDLAYYITASGADDTDFADQVVTLLPGEVADVNVTKWSGTTVAAPATAGIPEVNVKNMNNVSAAAITTIKAVQGLTTADTIATYTGNTPQTGDVYPKVDTEIADIQARLPAALTANGNMKSSMVEILTTALTETAGLLAGGFKKFFNMASPTGTINSIPDAVAGAASGLQICGSNAATTYATLTVTGATTLTGNVVLSDGLTVSAPSTGNRSGITVTGNGTGHGISVTSGNGATGDAINATAASTAGNGMSLTGLTTGSGLVATGGNSTNAGIKATGVNGILAAGSGTGPGIRLVGGGTSGTGMEAQGGAPNGVGMSIQADQTGSANALTVQSGGTSGHAIRLGTTSGSGVFISANGTNKPGMEISAANGPGIRSAGSTYGLDASISGNITGDITGNLSGSVGSVTGAVGSVTGAVGSVTGNVGGNVAGSVASVTAAVSADVTKISGSSTAADNLEAGAKGLVESTCAAGSTTTVIETNLTEATDDHYNGRVITFITGALTGQTTSISDYNGTTKQLTVVQITEAPADTNGFVIS